jgi:TolA-binding protein
MAFRWQWLLILALWWPAGGRSLAATAREDRAYAAAISAFQDKLWSRAETAFEKFIQKYPDSTRVADAVLLQARAQFNQGKLTNAIALLAARKAGAGVLADEYVYWIGQAQSQSGNLPAAAATFISLARDFPASPLRLRAVVEAAAAQAQMEEWPQLSALLEQADGVFQNALRQEPANELVIRGNLLLAQARLAQKDYAGATTVLNALGTRTLEPALDWQRAYLLYQVKLASGDTGAALAATTNLVQIAQAERNNVLQAEGVALRAEVLEQMGQKFEAIAACEEILKLNATPGRVRQAILKMAELAMAQNQYSNAAQSLERFLARFPASPAADVALLTLGELQLKEYDAQPARTNLLADALARFDQFLRTFNRSASAGLIGKAYLDQGWCLWLAGKTNAPETLEAFQAAAQRPLPPEELAEARFKMGDVLFAQTNFAKALENYRAVVENFTAFPAVTQTLGDRALYQMLRASLALTNYAGASDALEQILKQYPTNDLAASSALLYGQSLAEAATNHWQAAAAREVFEKFEQQFPGSDLRPQVELAIARTYEQELDWSGAIAQYERWRNDFTADALRPQADYALAMAHFRAGSDTNAFRLFTNFVARFPTNNLAPLAQWWVADYYFRLGGTNYMDAERSYKMLYQNTNWQGSPLVYPARMMAGRAAMGLSSYKDAIEHFTSLTSDTNCPADLNAQALFAYGSALMQLESTDTNNPLANFQKARDVFNQLCQMYPTNEPGVLAWNEIGDCDLQLANYDGATNAYARVFSSPYANLSARCRAQIGFGLALEKKAALVSDDDRSQLLQLALEKYLQVFDSSVGTDLRGDEVADPFWLKKAGLQALPLLEALGLADTERLNAFFDHLERLLPQLKDSLEKKRAFMLSARNRT